MLDGKKLGQDIWAKIKDEDPKKPEDLWETVGELICNHIKSNADVKPGISVTTPNGVGQTTGTGSIQ